MGETPPSQQRAVDRKNRKTEILTKPRVKNQSSKKDPGPEKSGVGGRAKQISYPNYDRRFFSVGRIQKMRGSQHL